MTGSARTTGTTGPGLVRRVAVVVAAPLLAGVIAVAVASIILLLSGEQPLSVFRSMFDFGTQANSIVSMINRAVPYYVAGLAVAIGFKMNLFNIGVEGQYYLAALVAAAAGSAVELPAPIHVTFMLLVAMAVGAAWAGIAGVLRATRGVSEVISTIMLNNIVALGLAAFILNKVRSAREGSLQLETHGIAPSGWLPSLNSTLERVGIDLPRGSNVTGFLVIAVLLGVGYHLLLSRSTFGFDLRASGLNPFAAQASGVAPKGMIVRAMLLSGAVAGLAGMSYLFADHKFTGDFTTGVGFTAIGIALVGRNHPVGIGAAALLWGFMERSAQRLDLDGIPKELVVIMQGVIVLSVVVAYEVVRRYVAARDQRAVSSQVDDERVSDVTFDAEGPSPEVVA